MTSLYSEKIEINCPAEHVFSYLCNFNNYEKLMPEQVVDWQSNQQEGQFTIKGMATIGLKIVDIQNHNMVKLDGTKSPFSLNLICNIDETEINKTKLQLNLNADLNPVLKMLAEKPLTNFIQTLAVNCKKNCEQQFN